ncbi:MAG: SDR family NAD(P)-dependent oxidoreductase [Hyphomicrobiaceae bacterium]
MAKTALIVGAGSGISASVAHALYRDGYQLMLACRHPDRIAALEKRTRASSFAVDASDPASMTELFKAVDQKLGPLDVALYNATYRTRGPIVELKPAEVHRTLEVGAFGGFLMAQESAKRMLPRKSGTILFTGASAAVKGYPLSAPFAMAKFALRGLAQSLARELHPQGVHVAHFNIDGGVRNSERGREEGPSDQPDSLLDPDGIAETYMAIIRQPRSAWSMEVELRPWVERF